MPDPDAVRQALAATGLTAIDRDDWLSGLEEAQSEGVRIGLTAILGMAGLYVAIAIVNTLIMAVRERAQDLALMRLAGATSQQALRTLLWEGSLVALIGIVLGGLVTGITMVAMQFALRPISATAQADLPWLTMGGVATICALLVLLTSLVTGAIALRRPPLETLAIPE
jgi:putative ABC transport system permease protein